MYHMDLRLAWGNFSDRGSGIKYKKTTRSVRAASPRKSAGARSSARGQKVPDHRERRAGASADPAAAHREKNNKDTPVAQHNNVLFQHVSDIQKSVQKNKVEEEKRAP